MTSITISDTPNGVMRTFETPGTRAGDLSNSPIGELTFANLNFVIASKLTTDIHLLIISATLPRNFVYRLRYASIDMQAASAGDIQEHEAAWTCLLTEDQVQVYSFPMYNDAMRSGVVIPSAFVANLPAVTNDYATFFHPSGFDADTSRVIIDASQGVSILTCRLMNVSGNATAAVNIGYRFEFDVFTVAQFNAVNINRSILTY